MKLKKLFIIIITTLTVFSILFSAEGKEDCKIFQAIKDGDIQKVEDILARNPESVNLKGDYGKTPLHCAAFEGQKEIAELLLEKGAEVDAGNDNGNTPLFEALCYDTKNSEDMVEILIEHDALVDAKNNPGETPLIYASSNGHKEAVKLLLENGANINYTTDNGWHALFCAAYYGNYDIVELLIDRGANKEDYPLHYAACTGNIKEMRYLIEEKNMDVNMNAVQNLTPLHFASTEDVAELLLKNLAEVNIKNEEEDLPLHYAAMYGFTDVAEVLIEYGADINGKNIYGTTPLCFAVYNDDIDMAELLLKNGADVNMADDMEKTCLDIAVSDDMKELLLEYGAKAGDAL